MHSPTLIMLLLSAAASLAGAGDPSGGWLTFAVYRAPKPTDIITKLSATMVVPETPLGRGGSPAFWFGTQTSKGDGALVQPIMAKWLGDGFYMFQEIFDWTDQHDDQTKPKRVHPGDLITASVSYKAMDRSCARQN
eukprot:SAG11_NODE_1475_length_4838_cov_3.412956_4_plen_136_part_00